jgi:hypothetical protein
MGSKIARVSKQHGRNKVFFVGNVSILKLLTHFGGDPESRERSVVVEDHPRWHRVPLGAY